MKKILQNSFVFVWWCLVVIPGLAQQPTANDLVHPYNEFGYGSNMGYYGNGWTDKDVARALHKAGVNTMRPMLSDRLIESFGVNVRLAEYQYYANTLGMKDHALFIGDPSDSHRDWSVYPGSNESSKLFANLYKPIWTASGTVNPDNYYAYYIYKLVNNYGPYVRFWEVISEPDLGPHNPPQWLNHAPLPSETVNIRAPFYHYIRMMRITWEVVKKYNPEDFVTTGGIGYHNFLDAMLRYTDNPDGGTVTPEYPLKGGAYFDVVNYHEYPNYDLRYWDNSIGGFRHTRNSDYAARNIIREKKAFEAVLAKYGYDGVTYPKKHFIITEVNVGRRTSDWRFGSDEMQRNFTIKSLVLSQKSDMKQYHIFAAGEKMNAPVPGTPVFGYDEFRLMGLYENLTRDKPGSEKFTQQGIAFKTTAKLLNGYLYDAARTAALNLPDNVDGGAFTKNGENMFVLWAKNPKDTSETFSVPYSFPDSSSFPSVGRFEWDYAVTNKDTLQASNGITLNTAPSFLKLLDTSVGVRISQTINFPDIAAKAFGDKFNLTATASSGLPVSFRVVSGPATLSDGSLTLTGADTVTVEATQSGSGIYEEAPAVTQRFVVQKAQAVISFNPLPKRKAGEIPFELIATSNNKAKPVTFSSSNPAVVSVSNSTGKWLATIMAAGTANITASQAGDQNHLAVADVVQSQVIEAAPSTTGEEGRIKVVSVTPAENTGMDYTPWLNDDLSSLVQSSWQSGNNKYVDVTLKLEQKSIITKILLYDESGTFTTNPAQIYALNGTEMALIATFTGEKWREWVDFRIDNVVAESIIVRKYGNNIPQKVNVYGKESPKIQSVISFAALANKKEGEAPFELMATSNNTATPITFVSSNPEVVSVSNSTGKWLATIVAVGTADITVSQAGDQNHLAAADVVQSQIVEAAPPTYGEEGRIKVVSVTPAENTGMNYTPWLNDDLNSLVQSSWQSSNYKYVDVTLKLEQKSIITKLSLYDLNGIFTTNPAEIYAVNGTERTLIATFTGEKWREWVDFRVDNVMAENIIVRKYGNNIPQKVNVYGKPIISSTPLQRVATGESEFFQSQLEPAAGVSWSVYPNPTSDMVQVQLSPAITGEVSIGVVDITGRVVKQLTLQKTTPQMTQEISLDNLPGGMYIIHLKAEGIYELKKILKK